MLLTNVSYSRIQAQSQLIYLLITNETNNNKTRANNKQECNRFTMKWVKVESTNTNKHN